VKLRPRPAAVKCEVEQINHWHFAGDHATNIVRFASERETTTENYGI